MSSAAKIEQRGTVLEMLRGLLAEGRVDEALAVVKQVLARNEELEKKLGGAHKREGVSTAQLLLVLGGLSASTDGARAAADQALREASGIDEVKPESPKPPRGGRERKPLPANLRRIENEIRVPDAQRPCPRCGGERACIGHDVTEVIDLIPAEVVVRRDAREKLACTSCEGELVRAPLGLKVVQGGRASNGAVAQILVDKYRDGLPLHRQAERFERLGWKVPVQTLSDQVKWGTDLLRPLWRASIQQVLAATVMHLDATSLPVLDRTAAKGIRLGSLWGYVGETAGVHTALYLYASTGKARGQKEGELGPEDMLERREGYTVADAAGLFNKSFEREVIIECGCNMHARRYFIKALDRGDARAALPVSGFKKLFDIEREIRGRDPETKKRVRQEQSKPVYDRITAWVRAHRPYEPPSSPLGRAMSYLLNHEKALRQFLDDGVVPIDNGPVERLHVRTALTRKNYLFAGSDAGGDRAAIAYSIIGSCVLAEVEPVTYLKDVFDRVGGKVRGVDMAALLPSSWTPRA